MPIGTLPALFVLGKMQSIFELANQIPPNNCKSNLLKEAITVQKMVD
jgi:hypothetical protein